MNRYEETRRLSSRLCEPLEIEDYVVQPMADASPPKWHLGHTTWFFEQAVLSEGAGYRPFHPQYAFLFNSYYNSFGPRWMRSMRGALSRPTVREVLDYRDAIDRRMQKRLDHPVAELGIHHEQQHQELLVTDIKAILSQSPSYPVYSPAKQRGKASAPRGFSEFAAGRYEIGFSGEGFAYDNEKPAHSVWVHDFALARALVTNAEYLEFINDSGYSRPELWLSDGWDTVQQQGWNSPLYWVREEGRWSMFTLSGLRPLNPVEPVCHVSYFEADAFARWKGMRLPTEAEWEIAAADRALDGSFLDGGHFHAVRAGAMFGEVWQWTASAYLPYPGFQPLPGALGEYNGKFMNGQYVLRGGSCATPRSHIRASYRNFFQPDKRWQFTGIRLAKQADPARGRVLDS